MSFKLELESTKLVSSEKWKWFFSGASNYIAQNEVFELNNFDTLGEIIKTLKVILKRSELLPKSLQSKDSLQNITDLRFRSINMMLEIKDGKYNNTPKLYEDLGKALRKISKLLSIILLSVVLSATTIESETIMAGTLISSPIIKSKSKLENSTNIKA